MTGPQLWRDIRAGEGGGVHKTTLWFTDRQWREIANEARARDITISSIIREMVRQRYCLPDEAVPRIGRPASPSADDGKGRSPADGL